MAAAPAVVSAVRGARFGHRARDRAASAASCAMRSRSTTASGTRRSSRRRGAWPGRSASREHRIMRVDLAGIGGSALTDPTHRRARARPTSGIPVTYVPARNTIMLSLALAWAEVLGAQRHLHRRECARLFAAIRIAGRSSSRRSPTRRAGHQGRRRRAAVPHPCAADRAHQGRDRPRGHAAGRGLRADGLVLSGGRGAAAPAAVAMPAACGARASPRPGCRTRPATLNAKARRRRARSRAGAA